MNLLTGVIVFIYGSIFGSFYNVVGIRLPKGELFCSKNSQCINCKKSLTWYELIPIFSFFIQKGRCTGCKTPISILYPLFEFLTGILFVISYLYFGFTRDFIYTILLLSFLLMISISDIYYFVIPNKLLLLFTPVLFLFTHYVSPLSLLSRLFGVVLTIVLLAVVVLLHPNGLGMGDVKLYLLLSYLFGHLLILHIILLSSGLALLYYYLSYRFGSKNLNFKLPFGPFIASSATIVYFIGNYLLFI